MSIWCVCRAWCHWLECGQLDGDSIGILREHTVYKRATSQKIKWLSQSEFQGKCTENHTKQTYSNQADIQWPQKNKERHSNLKLITFSQITRISAGSARIWIPIEVDDGNPNSKSTKLQILNLWTSIDRFRTEFRQNKFNIFNDVSVFLRNLESAITPVTLWRGSTISNRNLSWWHILVPCVHEILFPKDEVVMTAHKSSSSKNPDVWSSYFKVT